jgi:hypothetical protein
MEIEKQPPDDPPQRYAMSWEDVMALFPYGVPGALRQGGYRWFRAENVVAIEHFRKPHRPGQKAGRFGWL